MNKPNSNGFTLIELLITLVVIGVIAAIAIPNLASAIDRGKQKRTMADLRTIGTAVEAYSVDNGTYPVAETNAYTIASAGKDGAVSGCVGGTTTTQLDHDICFSQGVFTQYPVGVQN
jgi:prepilin-type N-terminal cleavage/methylation domain-containing protein